ncbi:2'-5' RNA ligase family protein [Sphingosinicella soli]|uniref:2'-5' RNA ligase n=1 Tax=Sphingosinicella soli TaxID=333708 RepID=A0A7W7B6T8_9SPHN|nr:2'-5' RNA ligase family protein [Sphingosinicella soli]MBB4633932.1 2'-5' RNA ligase [Sphingosinicella soli]
MQNVVFHRYLLALRPPTLLATTLALMGPVYRLAGTRLPADRLHITLAMIDGHFEAPQPALVERIGEALHDAALPAQRPVFDQLVRANDRALLTASEPLTLIDGLRDDLVHRLAAAGVDAEVPASPPHVTLAHGRQWRTGTEGIDPISWRADELVLIESHVGAGRHIARAQWPLGKVTEKVQLPLPLAWAA